MIQSMNRVHPMFETIEVFRINELPYIKSSIGTPIKEGDVVIDKRDLAWGIATCIKETIIGIKDGWVCEGVSKEYVQRLEIQTV